MEMQMDEGLVPNAKENELRDLLEGVADFRANHCTDDFLAVIPVNQGLQHILITVNDVTAEAASEDGSDLN